MQAPATRIIVWLVVCGAFFGQPARGLAEGACPQQPDWTAQWLERFGQDPNAPPVSAFGGWAVLGPVSGDPNVWEVPCGPRRLAYTWCDPEGMPCVGEVLEADVPCELTLAMDGRATLTISRVTYGWHVVHVRITDQPPEGQALPAHRDVLVVFFGQYGPNLPPILY